MNAVPEPSLSALAHLLAEQALLALGVPHPMMQEQPPANPGVGRFFIDLLALLKEKTEGHRTPAETEELDELIYQLRMRALQLATPEGAPQTREG